MNQNRADNPLSRLTLEEWQAWCEIDAVLQRANKEIWEVIQKADEVLARHNTAFKGVRNQLSRTTFVMRQATNSVQYVVYKGGKLSGHTKTEASEDN